MSDWLKYKEIAKQMGFLKVGVAPNHKIKVDERIRNWVDQNYHAEMHWYQRALEKRLDLSLVMEDATSVIVFTVPYHNASVSLGGKKLSRYACGDDYHDVLIKKLRSLCLIIGEDYPGARFKPYVDTGPVLEKYWAQEAGLGWIGKNGLIIDREVGSYLFLSCIVTNLTIPFPGTPPMNYCGECRACIEACPTDAIVQEGVVDAGKCISYLTIEQRGEFEDAHDLADWIFGCDICQEVCPWTNKFAPGASLDEFKPRASYQDIDERFIREMDQEAFSTTFRKSPIKRTKIAGLKRNLKHLTRMSGNNEPGSMPKA